MLKNRRYGLIDHRSEVIFFHFLKYNFPTNPSFDWLVKDLKNGCIGSLRALEPSLSFFFVFSSDPSLGIFRLVNSKVGLVIIS